MKRWKHTGGGCCVVCTDAYPCDDTYENQETNELVNFEATLEAHYKMPDFVNNLAEIQSIIGVGKMRTLRR